MAASSSVVRRYVSSAVVVTLVLLWSVALHQIASATGTASPVGPPAFVRGWLDSDVLYFYQGGDEFPCVPSQVGWRPNSSIWNYDIGYIANNEKQWYTAAPDNNFISSDAEGTMVCNSSSTAGDGVLQIVARESISYHGTAFNYTSSRLLSKGQFCVTDDSLVEVRARVPGGRGTWPAIWLLGPDSIEWPNTGEIDIMESVGYIPNRTFTTIHGFNLTTDGGTHIGGNASNPTLYSDFHVFQSVWNSSGIFFFTDNVSTFSVPRSEIVTWWPFGESRCFMLILNLAIGGDWGGIDGIDNSIFPVPYAVDYVRVYTSNISAIDEFWTPFGYNEPNQEFGLGSCGSTSLPPQWSLATLPRLQSPRFTPYVTNTPIARLDGCHSPTGNVFVGGVGMGYLFAQPGGVGWDVKQTLAGYLGLENNIPMFASAELEVYDSGLVANASMCCVYFSVANSTPAPFTPNPTTGSPTPTSTPTPTSNGGGNGPSSGLSSNTKAAIGIGVVLVAALLGAIVFLAYRHRRRGDHYRSIPVDAVNAQEA